MQQIIAFVKENIYVIMAALGAIAAVLITVDNFKSSKYNKQEQLQIVVVGILSLLIALFMANLANWFFFRDAMFALGKNYTFTELFSKAGFTFYAGLFTFFGVAALIFKALKFNLKELFYYLVPAVPLFHGIARVGCALSGCCYGITINLKLGEIVIEKFPTQFFETLFLFILFFLLEYKIEKGRTVTYFSAYAVFRFLIEFLRGDDRGFLIREIPLSPSQQMAIIVLFIVACYLVLTKLNKIKLKVAIIGVISGVLLLFSTVSAIMVNNLRNADIEEIKALYQAETELELNFKEFRFGGSYLNAHTTCYFEYSYIENGEEFVAARQLKKLNGDWVATYEYKGK